ncbi:MAG: hypothetical protein WCX65_07005, partial [bacterium]
MTTKDSKMRSFQNTRNRFSAGLRAPRAASRWAAVALFICLAAISSPAAASLSITQYAGLIDYTSLVYIMEKSDSYAWEHNVPNNISTYDETDYSEFGNFRFTSGTNPTTVQIRMRWCHNNAANPPDAAKLEVWEQQTGTWHNETGITIASTGCTTVRTRNVEGYINTASDLQNIKIRLLGYEVTNTATVISLNQLRIRANIGGTNYTYNAGSGISKNVLSLRVSDNVRTAYAADMLRTPYNEAVYQEFSDFGFTMPAGAEMGSTLITYEWMWDDLGTGTTMNGAKLEVWDQSSGTWNNSVLAIPAKLTDTTATVNAAAYANTADDINNIKFRFLGTAVLANSVGVRQDYVKIVAKRKILSSDIAVYAPGTMDFYPGSANQILYSFKVPDNDGVADTLTAIYVKNLGTAVNATDITNLRTCKDNDPIGTFGAEDTCRNMTWDAGNSRWYATGMTHAIP